MIAVALTFLGVAILVFGCWMIYAKKSLPELGAVLLVGVILVFFSDRDIQTASFSFKDGWSYKRNGADPSEVTRGLIKIALDDLNSDLQRKFTTLNAAILEVRNAGRNADPVLPRTSLSVPQPERGSALVFYRDGQEVRSRSIVDALKNVGYKSTATNSSLKEVEKWADRNTQGFIQVAVAGDNSQLASDLRRIISQTALSNNLSVTEGWSFQSSIAQIYLF